jgi:hypothetical protein
MLQNNTKRGEVLRERKIHIIITDIIREALKVDAMTPEGLRDCALDHLSSSKA